jgi:hypothetical protein
VLPLFQWKLYRRTAINSAAIVHQHIHLAVYAFGFFSQRLTNATTGTGY